VESVSFPGSDIDIPLTHTIPITDHLVYQSSLWNKTAFCSMDVGGTYPGVKAVKLHTHLFSAEIKAAGSHNSHLHSSTRLQVLVLNQVQ